MKKQIYAIPVLAALMSLTNVGYSQFIIDDFAASAIYEPISVGATPVNVDFTQTDPLILGGQRDIRLTNYRQTISALGCSIGLSGGYIDQSNGPGTLFSDFIMTYDGADDTDAGTLDATVGLGGLDLSGTTSFKTNVAYADPQTGISVMFRVYSSATSYSEASFSSIPSSFSAYPDGVDAEVFMADFSTGTGALSGADFTAVTAIQVIFKTPGTYGGFDWSWGNGVEVPSIFIAGNVFNDGNGMTNSTIDGTAINTVETAPLYANLINPLTDNVVATVPVKADGSYRFDFVKSDATYQVQLSTNQGIAGSAMPATALPANWVNTGEKAGTGTGSDLTPDGLVSVSVDNTSIGNVNFGINKIPGADNKIHDFTSTPPPGTTIPLNGTVATYGTAPVLLSGLDLEDGAKGGPTSKFVIDALPTNGTLPYNGTAVTAAQVASGFEFSNPALLSMQFTGSGYDQTVFSYSFVDNAGFKGTSATYTINLDEPLPVTLSFFEAVKNGKKALLKWSTSTERNNSAFWVERSSNGNNWAKIGVVNTMAEDGNSNQQLDYSFVDEAPPSGTNMYQLKQIDIDGRYEYSTARILHFDIAALAITTYPNPVDDKLNIIGLSGSETIVMYDFTGKKILSEKVSGSSHAIDMTERSPANYSIIVIDAAGNTIATSKVVKRK